MFSTSTEYFRIRRLELMYEEANVYQWGAHPLYGPMAGDPEETFDPSLEAFYIHIIKPRMDHVANLNYAQTKYYLENHKFKQLDFIEAETGATPASEQK